MIKCTNCSHENTASAQICEVCGHLLVQPSIATKKYDDADYEEGTPKWGSARFNGGTNLVLDVLETKRSFVFDADEITRLIIGRKDPDDTNPAIVDLTGVGGLEKGVSRRHAEIVRQDGALHIVDNGSSNGTYLNGQKLVAEQARVLRDGDDIRLGHLTVRVTFRAASRN